MTISQFKRFKKLGNLETAVCWRCKQELRPTIDRYYDNNVSKHHRKNGPICIPCLRVEDPGFTLQPDEPGDVERILHAMMEFETNTIEKLRDELVKSNMKLAALETKVIGLKNALVAVDTNFEVLDGKLDRLLSRSSRSAWEIENKIE